MGQHDLWHHVASCQDGGDPAVRAAFQKTMTGDFDNANDAPYTPLEMFVMELFRTISPNGGSISAIHDARNQRLRRVYRMSGSACL